MNSEDGATVTRRRYPLLIAAALPVILFALQGTYGFSLRDEGFLWYGAQRVMAGEVPLRDFQSYDIGRYYWSAAIMSLLGSKGILAMRISNVVLQAAAMALATHLVMKASPRVGLRFAVLAAGTFVLWMLAMDFKAADYAASILLIFALALVLETPNLGRAVACGAIVGFVAILGRNHGVYGAAAGLGAIAYLAYKKQGPRPLLMLTAWAAGIFLGYLPMLVMLVVVPGFASEFWESIMGLFKLGATNLAIPWPRPWQVQFHRQSWPEELRQLIFGVLFIALPLFGIAGLGLMLRKRLSPGNSLNPVFVAAVLLALPYAHYAFSRADKWHLSFGIFPLLIGAMTFPFASSPNARRATAGALFALSLYLIGPVQPGYQALLRGNWKTIIVGTDTLKVEPELASEVTLLVTLAERYAPNGESFLATPYWPGAYALFARKSPIREIYGILPVSEADQRAEIARIGAANPSFVVVTDYALDKREDLRYQYTHRLIDSYVKSTFQPVNTYVFGWLGRHQVYARNAAVPNPLPVN